MVMVNDQMVMVNDHTKNMVNDHMVMLIMVKVVVHLRSAANRL